MDLFFSLFIFHKVIKTTSLKLEKEVLNSIMIRPLNHEYFLILLGATAKIVFLWPGHESLTTIEYIPNKYYMLTTPPPLFF